MPDYGNEKLRKTEEKIGPFIYNPDDDCKNEDLII
jgi:hypothetical protein